jgi:hypothetical protein
MEHLARSNDGTLDSPSVAFGWCWRKVKLLLPNALLDLFHKEVLSDWFAMIGGLGMGRGDQREMIRGIACVWKTWDVS